MSTLIASAIEALQVALQISSPTLPPVSLKQQHWPTFPRFPTSLTMTASVREVQARQPALPHLRPHRHRPPNSIFSITTAFAKEVQALLILQVHLVSLPPSQVGALLSTSQAQSAVAAKVAALPQAVHQE